jgi:hypothetical protein
MKYMFSVGQFLADGSWLMPAEKVVRWQRQLATTYADLTAQEQASDQRQADKVLKVLVPSKRERIFQRHRQYYLGQLVDKPLDEQSLPQLRLVAAREIAA